MKLLDATELDELESHLEQKVIELLLPNNGSLGRLMHQYVMRPGKRVRPQLAAWTYRQAGRAAAAALPPCVLDVAAAWELFHAFLLVHDDIIDGADYRRADLALHRQLQSLDSDSPRFGTNLGIVAGDLMYAAVNRILSDLDVPAEEFRAVHRLFARVAQLTGSGQAIDVMQSHTAPEACDEAALLRQYCWKTSAYTFEGPMLSGATLAGAGPDACAAISAFAVSLGQAYQLQNDLQDLARPVTEGADMAEGKRTVTLLRARQLLGEGDRAAFDADLAQVQAAEGKALVMAESLRQRVTTCGALEATRHTIDHLLVTAAAAAESNALPPRLSAGMSGLLQNLRAGYFASV